MDHLRFWAEEILARTPSRLKGSHRVKGEFSRIGPRQQYAKVEFLVEPAEEFEVVIAVEGTENEEFLESALPDWAVLGLLDIVLVAWPHPLRNIKVTLMDADDHPLWSSRMAFRMAGREAGRRLVEAEDERWRAERQAHRDRQARRG